MKRRSGARGLIVRRWMQVGLLAVAPALCAGCASAGGGTRPPESVYRPTLPAGGAVRHDAEAALAALLGRAKVEVRFSASARFPDYRALKGFVDQARPALGNATHLYYLTEGDPILRVEASGIDVSGGLLELPVLPLAFDDLAGFPIGVQGARILLPQGIAIDVLEGRQKAVEIADLLLAVQQGPRVGGAMAEFEVKAAAYRALATKPRLSEDQRRLIVQANAFNQQKDYYRAIERFRAAVALDATAYPAAYFNLALLYAQVGNPRRAILHMRQYLLLEPEAKDARAGQDKIYEWEALLDR